MFNESSNARKSFKISRFNFSGSMCRTGGWIEGIFTFELGFAIGTNFCGLAASGSAAGIIFGGLAVAGFAVGTIFGGLAATGFAVGFAIATGLGGVGVVVVVVLVLAVG